MKALIWLLLGTTHCATADVLELHLRAAHYDTKMGQWSDNFNNVTPGIGWRTQDWAAGVYHNSFKQTSVYLLREIPVGRHAGLEIGVATGYQDLYGQAVQPMAAAYLEFGPVRLRILPGEVVAFGLSVQFK